MAKTYTDFENEVAQKLSGSYKTLIDTAKQNAATDKQTINAGADASIKSIKDNNAVLEKEAREDYENKLQTNEVQRVLNERYIARKAAEMGLTDSGLNRTQQTAVQLSYANQKGDLEQQSQKTIDTLAATMQADINQVNIKRNADIAGIDTTLNTNLANLKSSFINDVVTNANERYNTYLENLRKEEEAKQKEYDNLLDKLNNSSYSAAYKRVLIEQYAAKNGYTAENTELTALLDFAGLEVDSQTGKFVDTASKILPLAQRTWTKTKDTVNGNGSIDWNDEVTDQYGNTLKLKELQKQGFSEEMLLKLTNTRDYSEPVSFGISDKDVGQYIPYTERTYEYVEPENFWDMLTPKYKDNFGNIYGKKELMKLGVPEKVLAQAYLQRTSAANKK